MTTVLERIENFNQGRIPELVHLKYQNMRADPFAFFRGTCHLFYEDWAGNTVLNTAPAVWVCGDLHLENFGSYKGDNRLVYFDINDFDEAILAPCTWDLARFLTSVLVGFRSLEVNESEALALCNCFIDNYISALAKGQARTVERETAVGMVKDLLLSLKERDRKKFLDQRTHEADGKRKLRIDEKRTRAATKEQRLKITHPLENWASQQPDPKFFKVLDVAYRIAGTGSLGVERYVILIEAEGSPNHNYLLDLKAESTSALQRYLSLPQPDWSNQAQRVIAIQNRVQGTPPALLAALESDGKAYVLRELQPLEDRVNLKDSNGKFNRLEKVIRTMSEVVAWGQLRSSGRQKSAIADELIDFASATNWRQPLLDYARAYSAQVEKDYTAFCAELKDKSYS
ncbi:DUF2252 domain-containing protein [Aetokthonos hydrillicola Thurmond2011]|jgi:uncharacterized protein (DUF2252 family)|uniref:DUF2252 domain-containing protein n=1 Tax=Aetokthonos hydrillicola Thurmond2011 TaxID=2712845 RepID=A0AAP5I284_9CYAN|nr:DUF2252 domain-containing protein [Aetokthonos hydrillicola]MBO3457490.1 DUF2252 domain-containing protein [Aetokthonos hydrillicola CCALA 1050]MBW4585988.1 DUF2252 domain-containing protein [Aetokthonos hydrillicola CCALA 1050]MDR9893783.1 DUF2252 domain-containing protein [Aetokthonos hydrillicola Thurmond2011]